MFGVALIKPRRYAVRILGFHVTKKKKSIVPCYFVCLWFLGDIIYALQVVVGKSDDCISDRSYGFYR